MTKLEKLAAGRPMRIVIRSLTGEYEGPFEGKTFREARELAPKRWRNWHWFGLYAGDELVFQVHK